MKVNFDTKIFDAHAIGMLAAAGMEMSPGDEKLTARSMIGRILVNGIPGEKMEADTKLKDYELLLKITTGGADVDLVAEDVARLKMLAGKVYPPLLLGRLHEILDPKPKAAVA
jgi:hypothetical protein